VSPRPALRDTSIIPFIYYIHHYLLDKSNKKGGSFMPFDLDKFTKNHLESEINKLEEKRDKLRYELRQVQQPSTNRMLAESLGTNNTGIHFQQTILVFYQDEQVIGYVVIEENPHELVELTSSYMYRNGIQKIGDAFYEKRNVYKEADNGNITPGFENIKQNPLKYLPTFYINGKHYFLDREDYDQEFVGDNVYDELPSELKGRPNGIYHILVEGSIWGGGYAGEDYWDPEYELEFKIYESVPLYEYLTRKDELIADALGQAEELADQYIYIQQTKQQRFYHRHEEEEDEDWLCILKGELN
jgi:hypothetical protein